MADDHTIFPGGTEPRSDAELKTSEESDEGTGHNAFSGCAE